MNKKNFNINKEQKELVIERFKTLNPESKLSLGGDKEVTVKELIEHVEKGDDFGKRIVKVQMNMIRVLSGAI